MGLAVDVQHTNNIVRCAGASLLALHATARPSHALEPIPREDMEARNKLHEARPTELKLILGWLFDLRRLIISLPDNKHQAWHTDINTIVQRGTSTAPELETLIGRLGHLGVIMPYIYHFLSRLRDWQFKAAKRHHPTPMSSACRLDLELMQTFLLKAYQGIDMNLLTFQRPTHVYRSDSCPFGMGGYSHTRYAWRYALPPNLRFRASNNLLEFIASIITPWVDMLAHRLSRSDCALSMTDSTTSAGWLRRSSFREVDDSDTLVEATTRINIARHHASLFLNADVMEYSQWFEG